MSSTKTFGVGFAAGFVLAAALGLVGCATVWWNGYASRSAHASALADLEAERTSLEVELLEARDREELQRADASICDAERELDAMNFGIAAEHVDAARAHVDRASGGGGERLARLLDELVLTPGTELGAQRAALRAASTAIRSVDGGGNP